jgi:hypothetical protein
MKTVIALAILITITAANPTRLDSSDLRADKQDERAIAITAAGVSAGIYGLSEYQKACYNQGCYAWWCPNWICSAGRNDEVRANEQNEYQDCLEKAGNNAFPKDIEDCLHMSHMEFVGMGDLMAGCMDEDFTTLEELETEVAECLGEEIPEERDGEGRLLFSTAVTGATSWWVSCKSSHCASWWCPSSLC